jgi:precorrin-6Y C5,15-methyltransferase (decarboxylating)
MVELTIIGCDDQPLSAEARAVVSRATLVVGGARHLALSDSAAERIVLGDVARAFERLVEHDGPAAILASGDPGFFGIVRLARRNGLRPTVIPAVSSVARAYAGLGQPWDDALVVSAHGPSRPLERAANVCRAHPKVAVLTGPDAQPPMLARSLQGWPRRIIVASRLGSPDERFTTPEGDWAEPNVALVFASSLCHADGFDATTVEVGPTPWLAGSNPGPAGWALPEAEFEHRGTMITRSEVRALTLARLGPRLGDLVWDVGAGSGSIAIESARFGAAVIAIDRDPQALQFVRRNMARHTVNVLCVSGEAPEVLESMPDPDAVFVGGGGLDVLHACLARRPQRIVATFAGIERVGSAATVMSGHGYEVGGVQLQANRLADHTAEMHRWAATNPVALVWGTAS